MDGGGHDGNVSVFDKRRGGKGLANGLVDYHIETPDKIKSIFEGAGISTPSYNKLKLNNQQSIDTFKKAIAKAKQSLGDNGASVELKDDYTDINLYLSEDGESGFGVKPNGDIVSVFSSENVKGRSAHMLEMAIYEGGGRQLDCFDIYLTKIYETHGFKPVAKMKWDDEYIPEGWKAKARMLRKENFKDYNNGWNRGDSEANKVLWNKYKNEYEEYKRSNKAAQDGHERLKEYLSKYDINIDSKVFVDSLIDLNNYIDKEDVDITEEEINNDIEYYIDSVKEYIDKNIPAGTEWKTLENGEHILVNSATGEVIEGAGGSLNKDKDKNKDKKDGKREHKKIDFDNIKKVDISEIKRAEDTLERFYNKKWDYDRDEVKKDLKNHLKYLDEYGYTGALFNNIRKRIEDALNDKNNIASEEDIKKAISKLPKAQQSSAELIYNNIGSKKANELFSKYEQTIDIFKLKEDESKTGAAKRKVYNELTDGARAIYGFSSIREYKFYNEVADKEIINLINNSPNPPATVYRGEGLNRIAFKNIQIGQSYFEIKQNNRAEENYNDDIEIKNVNSSNASYDMGQAVEYAEDGAGTKVVHVFENTNNISSVSYYDYENECFIDKREQILYDIYKDKKGIYYLMYQPKNIGE
ncbi:hypothetical protein [uncultured Brachyspira sp.]|uniref:hypothetical protein n=1 Tax=uncultured Brachyspira sp. TaxID=221953 RepID=UPI0027DC8652|nr:hypothetical protein [uncultured Brachyspira sp.]